MPIDVTAAVDRALEAAARWADRTGAAEIEAVHVALALLEEDGGRPAGMASDAGLDRLGWLDRCRSADHPGNPVMSARAGAELEAILGEARRVAADLAGER